MEVKTAPPHSKGMKGYAARWKGLSKNYSHAPAQTARIQLPFFPGRRSHCLESPCLETVALSLTTDYGLRTADCGRIEVIERDIQRRGRVRQGADADTVHTCLGNRTHGFEGDTA